MLWVPVFFAAYLALLALPFGLLWLAMVPVSSVAFLTMGYVGHDAGHGALARNRAVNDFWGQFGMTFLCGFSFGYWRSRHNQHHAHCQEVGGDPDMRFGVLFSVYPNSDNWHSRGGRFFLRVQKWAFWPLSSLYWVSLRYDGIRDLFQQPDKTKVDRFLLPLHWIVLLIVPGFIFGWPAAVLAYVSVSCISSLMTASVFIPNHIGMRRLASGRSSAFSSNKSPPAATSRTRRCWISTTADSTPRSSITFFPASPTTACGRCGRSYAPSAWPAASRTRRPACIARSPRSAITWAR